MLDPSFCRFPSPKINLDRKHYRGLSSDGIEQSRRQIDDADALSLLASGQPSSPDGALGMHELTWAGRLLRLACDLTTARLALGRNTPLTAVDPETRRTLGNRLEPLRLEHETIWLASNRPGGRLDSLVRLERLQRAPGQD